MGYPDIQSFPGNSFAETSTCKTISIYHSAQAYQNNTYKVGAKAQGALLPGLPSMTSCNKNRMYRVGRNRFIAGAVIRSIILKSQVTLLALIPS